MTPTDPTSTETAEVTASYESNLDRLRRVVDQLEKGSPSLESSLALFEEGMALSQLCDRQLAAVEERVKVLVTSGAQLDLATRKDIELEVIKVESGKES